MLGDLLHLALYLIIIALWIYFWLLCMFSADVSLKRFLGAHAQLICALGIPAVAAGLVGAAIVYYGVNSVVWILSVTGIAVPLLGLLVLRRTRRRRYYFDGRP
jgi:maltodextrin utilization protein YvdJ